MKWSTAGNDELTHEAPALKLRSVRLDRIAAPEANCGSEDLLRHMTACHIAWQELEIARGNIGVS
jgi:hypothetical protein